MVTAVSRRKKNERHRDAENIIYASMWAFVIMLPVVNGLQQASHGQEFLWNDIFRHWSRAVPFLILFLIHNSVLIPAFLLDGKIKRYSAGVLILLGLFFVYEHAAHSILTERFPLQPWPQIISHSGAMTMTALMNGLLGVLVLGFNLAIFFLFKYYREQENLKSLDRMRLQEELKYLKAQINPHFFMNMLNNIHAMVEIDQDKAQAMILELSKLMRYVLYEGDSSMTTFADEVRFISSYVALMRQRYHPDKVDIELSVPMHPSDKLKLPPLLFIAFVENAFKHGISYRRKSTVRISLRENDGQIHFFCRNTKPEADNGINVSGGVGLENVKRRLDLLYEGKSSLRIENGSDYYTVNLVIPCR